MPKIPIRAAVEVSAATVANLNPALATALNPTNLHTLRTVQLAPNSLAQVKQAILPTVQQLAQAAGFQLSAADVQELNQAFIDRGTIQIASVADSGNSLNVEATSLTWSSAQANQAINE